MADMKTLVLVAMAAGVCASPASAQNLPFDKGWELSGDRTRIVMDGARQVLETETGFAHRRDMRFEDGTIDFDVQVTDRRSFIYVYFRTLRDGEREEFYLRPHKSNLPDAVQYAPVWQNRSAWQLYHGAGGTAAVAFQPGAWTHVRVIAQGRHAALFVGDMSTPALLVPRLAREPQPGHVALGAFLPANVPGEGPIARFSNVVVTKDVAGFDFAAAMVKAATPSAPPSGIVRAWSVSRGFVPKTDAAAPAIPPVDVTGAFSRFETDDNGLLPLERHVALPKGSRATAAVSRINVRAERAGAYALDIGFSDIATVFVNGEPVFHADASYSFDRPRREGLIGFDQARLYLPLEAGDNDVAILVSDVFGGWGLMGRFLEPEGLRVTAR